MLSPINFTEDQQHAVTPETGRFDFYVRLIAAMFQSWPLSRKQRPVSADLIKENMEKCCP
jgi:hypothetical protein